MLLSRHEIDENNEDEIDGACVMHRLEENCLQDFGGKTYKKTRWKT